MVGAFIQKTNIPSLLHQKLLKIPKKKYFEPVQWLTRSFSTKRQADILLRFKRINIYLKLIFMFLLKMFFLCCRLDGILLPGNAGAFSSNASGPAVALQLRDYSPGFSRHLPVIFPFEWCHRCVYLIGCLKFYLFSKF